MLDACFLFFFFSFSFSQVVAFSMNADYQGSPIIFKIENNEVFCPSLSNNEHIQYRFFYFLPFAASSCTRCRSLYFFQNQTIVHSISSPIQVPYCLYREVFRFTFQKLLKWDILVSARSLIIIQQIFGKGGIYCRKGRLPQNVGVFHQLLCFHEHRNQLDSCV